MSSFISPAIVQPETVDVAVPRDMAVRRGLMVIAKIIQNLANNVRFGKEAHMVCFNGFLSENIVRVMKLLQEVNVRILLSFHLRFLVNILLPETHCARSRRRA